MIILANIAAALYAGALVLTHLLGWDEMRNAGSSIGRYPPNRIAAGTYTLLGGLKAVIYCDFVQMLVLMLGGALLLYFGIGELGGIKTVLANSFDGEGQPMWSLYRPWDHPYGWLPMLTGGLVLGVHGHCTDHDYIQRALSAGSLYHAKTGPSSRSENPALFFIAAPGVVAAQLFQGQEPIARDNAYVSLLTEVMPVGLGLC